MYSNSNFIFKQLKKHKTKFVLLFLLIIIESSMHLSIPLIYKKIIDHLIEKNSFNEIIYLTIIHFIISSGIDIVYTIKAIEFKKLGTLISFNIRNNLLEHILNLPIFFFHENKQGDIFTKLTGDVEAIENFTTSSVISIITNLIEALAIVVIMCFMNLKLTIISLIFIPITHKLHSITNPKVRKLSEDIRENISEINSVYYEVLNNIFLVKIFNGIKKSVIRTIVPTRKYAKLRIKLALYSNLSSVFAQIATCSSTILLFYIIGGYDVYTGKMTLGELLAFSFYMAWIVRPVLSLFKTRVMYNKVKVSYRRIQDLFDKEEEDQKVSKEITFNDKIKINNLSFNYPENELSIIQNLNMSIIKNETTAIVGHSGCGKTTIVNLLLKLFNTYTGDIYIDNQNYKDLSNKKIRKFFGVITQDSFLFDGSIEHNLTMFLNKVSKDQIVQACKIADIYKYIQTLPEGFNTIIGEKGVKLSGGQKQRLAIARAILYEPKVLVLDEATSHLDNESEYNIKKALESLQGKMTILVIAHRLSTIVNADHICVMKDGKIIKKGKHIDLLNDCKIYKRMWSINNEN